jgi:hypothetical protein
MRTELGAVVALPAALSACSDGGKLSMDECQKDADCLRAYELVVSANQAVASACPKDVDKTKPACDSAMSTLNTAEEAIAPRLTPEAGASLTYALMGSR